MVDLDAGLVRITGVTDYRVLAQFVAFKQASGARSLSFRKFGPGGYILITRKRADGEIEELWSRSFK